MSRLASLLLILLWLSISHTVAHSQQPGGQRAATKFDEFGDIQYSDKIARLDNLAINAQEQPGAKVFIVVYITQRHLPGLNSRLRAFMKDYLVMTRGMAEKDVITVDGGFASNLIQQLWIAPPGTTPTPHPDTLLPRFKDTRFPWKFDDFSFGNEEGDLGYSISEQSSFEAFADEVRRSNNAVAYVIYYPGYFYLNKAQYNRRGEEVSYRRKLFVDSTARANLAMKRISSKLEKIYGLGSGRVKVVSGGYREWRSVELWVLPRTAHPPVATPNRFPKKRSQRK